VLFIAVQSQRTKCSVVQVSLFKNVHGRASGLPAFVKYFFLNSEMANFQLRASALARMSPYGSAAAEQLLRGDGRNNHKDTPCR
jgi:hypothetical protein